MVRSQKDSNALDQLVTDCLLLNLNEKEALQYISKRFGKPLSVRGYYHRKKNVNILDNANQWLDGFTKSGVVIALNQIIDAAQKQFNDTYHQLYVEEGKEPRDENLILKLKADLRDEGMYFMKLSDTTPIFLKIKQISDENERNKTLLNNRIRQDEDRFPQGILE